MGLQNRPISSIVLKVGIVEVLGVAVSLLGDDDVGVAIFAGGADALDAVITAFMAAIFAFRCVFSRHFFFWARLPCPGPGIAEL